MDAAGAASSAVLWILLLWEILGGLAWIVGLTVFLVQLVLAGNLAGALLLSWPFLLLGVIWLLSLAGRRRTRRILEGFARRRASAPRKRHAAGSIVCSRCHAQLDVAGFSPGERLTCGSCGQVLVAPHAVAPRSRAEETEEESEEREQRLRVSLACTASFVAGLVGFAVAYWSGRIAFGFGVAAVLIGLWGIWQLGRLGIGRRRHRDVRASERGGARSGRRAYGEATAGFFIGIGVVFWTAFAFGGELRSGNPWVVKRAAAVAQEEGIQAGIEYAERHGKPGEPGWDLLAEQVRDWRVELEERKAESREVAARNWLNQSVRRYTRTPTYRAPMALPEDVLARRLRDFLHEYEGTRAARDVLHATGEPWATYRRILDEHPEAGGAEE